MSAIRPDLPSTLFPTAPQPAAQAARSSDFFSAALAGVSPTPLSPGKALTARAAPLEAEPVRTAGRDMRPGSLLDIRV